MVNFLHSYEWVWKTVSEFFEVIFGGSLHYTRDFSTKKNMKVYLRSHRITFRVFLVLKTPIY